MQDTHGACWSKTQGCLSHHEGPGCLVRVAQGRPEGSRDRISVQGQVYPANDVHQMHVDKGNGLVVVVVETTKESPQLKDLEEDVNWLRIVSGLYSILKSLGVLEKCIESKHPISIS